METYPKDEILQHNYVPQTQYPYNDPGRFDTCHSCLLKLAVMAMKSKK